MNEFENENQTQFAVEEPILSGTNVEIPVEEKSTQKSTAKKPLNKKVILIVVMVFITILLIFLVISLSKIQKDPVSNLVIDRKPDEIEALGPFQERIESARADLEVADPANQDIAFPPVDMNLRLDKKER